MILIADSGSTKTDWVVLQPDLTEAFRTHTIGLNPYHINAQDIQNEISKNEDLCKIGKEVSHIYFYGAGCSADYLKDTVKQGLGQIFTQADILVQHDLLAACYAAYRGKPAMVCILGTGSNACYFDGENLREETPSLAYILGDEGSGNHLGRKLLHAYFSKKLPKHLAEIFYNQYQLTITELNKNVYQTKFANAYLASFSTFVHENKSEPYLQNMIYDAMMSFFENQVIPHHEARFSEVNFIGSVAHYYEDILRAAAAEFHLEVGQIVRKPIDQIVDYHIKYILQKP